MKRCELQRSWVAPPLQHCQLQSSWSLSLRLAFLTACSFPQLRIHILGFSKFLRSLLCFQFHYHSFMYSPFREHTVWLLKCEGEATMIFKSYSLHAIIPVPYGWCQGLPEAQAITNPFGSHSWRGLWVQRWLNCRKHFPLWPWRSRTLWGSLQMKGSHFCTFKLGMGGV